MQAVVLHALDALLHQDQVQFDKVYVVSSILFFINDLKFAMSGRGGPKETPVSIFSQWARKLKKVQAKKLVKSNKSKNVFT